MSGAQRGWSEFCLADLGGTRGGKTPSKAISRYWSREIPWASPKDMKAFRLNSTEDRIARVATTEAGMNVFPVGSVLVVIRSGILAHTLPVAITDVPMTINQDLKAIQPNAVATPRYLAYALRANEREILHNCAKEGTTVASVETEKLESFRFPLPPRPEQERIADKLDSLLARVDACRQRLDHVPAILKRFRQSVLSAATGGDLTRDWREARGLPDWTTEEALSVCEKVQSGGTPRLGFTTEGVPFLKVYNIVDQQVAFDYRPQFVSPSLHHGALSKSIARPGDVLMNIVGPPLGKVAIVPDTHPEWNVNQAITLFRPGSRVTSEWLYLVLCEGSNVRAITHDMKGTVGQVNISLSQCRAFEFPVPSIQEQEEIARRASGLLESADLLMQRVETASETLNMIGRGVLAKAFRGELVPQDPNDEPASELLARLRREQIEETRLHKVSKRPEKSQRRRSS